MSRSSRAFNSFPLLAFVSIFAFLARSAHAQALGPTVEMPTTRQIAVQAVQFVDQNVIVAREDKNVVRDNKDIVDNKSSKEVLEQAPAPCSWHFYAEAGYESEYNFRGTNLTPNAAGAGFADAEVSWCGLTLGVYDVYQLGTAHAPSFSMGEGGGGGASTLGSFSNTGPVLPETFQDSFNETDLFLQYSHAFGPISITAGNIAFFIQRSGETFLTLPDAPNPKLTGSYGPYHTVGDEQFDRLFIRISTSVIPHIEPGITYYQTVLSEGEDPFFHKAFKQGPNPSRAYVFFNSFERSPEHYGGYLVGRLKGNFRLCELVDFNPFGEISYSFGDRSEPVSNPTLFAEVIRGRPLRDWNAAQTGVELPIHIVRRGNQSILNVVPFAAYSYHISTPPPGTDRNEAWGGVKLAVSF